MRRIREDYERIAKQLRTIPAPDLEALLQATETISPALQEAARLNRELQVSFAGVANGSAIQALEQQLKTLVRSRPAELYRLPYREDLAQLHRMFDEIVKQPAWAGLQPKVEEFVATAAALGKPWISTGDAVGSLKGFSGLALLGDALASASPFSDSIAQSIRVFLGDWRTMPGVSDRIAFEPPARLDFYEKLGFERSLADFPSPSFEASLDVTGITLGEIPRVPKYERPIPSHPVEEGLAGISPWNAKAYCVISRFEPRLRQFIDRLMTGAYGPGWTKRQTGDFHKSWSAKKEADRVAGSPDYPLICYANFTDYLDIIVRKDNWDRIFKLVFCRKESVTESLKRLYPIRLATMHSRPVVQDDILFLYSEVRRLLRAIDEFERMNAPNT